MKTLLSLPTWTPEAPSRPPATTAAAVAGQRRRKRPSHTQSSSQARRQDREQPPSAHTSASCARLEPVESTSESYITERERERESCRRAPEGGMPQRGLCPRRGRPTSHPSPAPARAPFRVFDSPLSATTRLRKKWPTCNCSLPLNCGFG